MHMPIADDAQPDAPSAPPRLSGRLLLLARVAWIAVAIVTLALDAAGIPVVYHAVTHDVRVVCATASCDNIQLTPAQITQLHALGLSLGFYALYIIVLYTLATLVYAGIAAVIFWRRSDDRMALLGAFTLVTFGGAAFNGTMQVLPSANPIWSTPTLLLNMMGQITFYVFFCVFPSGRFVPRWTRWAVLAWAMGWTLQLLPNSSLVAVGSLITNGPVFAIIIALLVLSQIYRYRRASSLTQRQQTKWAVFGFVIGIGGFLGMLIIGNLVLSADQRNNILGILISNTLLYCLFLLIPVTIALAILRSRLWEIDTLINRTLVYGLLTALLAAIYAGLTIGLESLLGPITGTTSQRPVVIVIATLAIAALFQPLRSRIQAAIDRRFYRRRYDAAKTLAAFSATLRQEVDLHDLRDDVLSIVEETMQPAHVSLWLRPRDQR